MPIYAYRCQACGFAKDVLQKMSDALLTDCPSCNQPSFKKQLTAAGFQLKGTGWYATDFRGGASAKAAPDAPDAVPAAGAAATTAAGTAEVKSEAPATPTAPAPAAPSAT